MDTGVCKWCNSNMFRPWQVPIPQPRGHLQRQVKAAVECMQTKARKYNFNNEPSGKQRPSDQIFSISIVSVSQSLQPTSLHWHRQRHILNQMGEFVQINCGNQMQAQCGERRSFRKRFLSKQKQEIDLRTRILYLANLICVGATSNQLEKPSDSKK